jgi:hypothetical protein
MRLTMTGLALAAAMRGQTIRTPRKKTEKRVQLRVA